MDQVQQEASEGTLFERLGKVAKELEVLATKVGYDGQDLVGGLAGNEMLTHELWSAIESTTQAMFMLDPEAARQLVSWIPDWK